MYTYSVLVKKQHPINTASQSRYHPCQSWPYIECAHGCVVKFAPPIANSWHDSPTLDFKMSANILLENFTKRILFYYSLFRNNGDIFSRPLWPVRVKIHWLRSDFPRSVNNGNILIRGSSNHQDTSNRNHVYIRNTACGYILRSFLYKFGTSGKPNDMNAKEIKNFLVNEREAIFTLVWAEM